MTDRTPPTGFPPVNRAPVLARILAALAIAALLAANGWVSVRRRAYAAEIDRLRASMTGVERQRADEVLARDEHTLRMAIELMRRQARLEPALHLTVSVDSARMYLERDGAILREMPVEFGPERRVGVVPDTVRLATPRGMRTVARIVGERDPWEVPSWVYLERGIPVDSNRSVAGGLGPVAVLLEGGTILYSLPSAGPLNDSSYVLPGAVRARAEDLRAILPNLTAGMRVYLY